MLLNCLAVALGGGIGSVCRYLIGLLPFLQKGPLPLQTLLVNVLGAVLIGVIVKSSESCPALCSQMVLFLKVGICGGFTTFSTFSLETFALLQEGKLLLAGIYILASVALCLAGVFAGQWLAESFS